MINNINIQDIVFLEPAISYEDALIEMLSSDGLIILQASNCNHQIPAKVYEYFRAGKAILALTDSTGDTAKLLRKENMPYIFPLDNKNAIEKGILQFYDDIINQRDIKPKIEDALKYSRQSRAIELSTIFNETIN